MIAVALFGIFTGVLIQQYTQWRLRQIHNLTTSRQFAVQNALSQYVLEYGALPCPADPAIPPTAPTAGQADCMNLDNYDHTTGVGPAYPPNISWPHCNANQECIVAGARATIDNPTFDPNTGQRTYNDPVLIGTIPYVALGVSLNDTIDGWGNRMTYAVSYYATDPNLFNYSTLGGAINIEDFDTGQNKIAPMLNNDLDPGYQSAKSFMFVFLSAGPNGRGAWNYEGAQPNPCQMGVPIALDSTYTGPSTGRDNENCNNDSTFLYTANSSSAGAQDIYSTATGPFFDDDYFMVWQLDLSQDAWMAYSQNLKRAGNKTGGKVGIGTSAPTVNLDVMGNIKADNVQSDIYCDETTGKCFNQQLLSPGLDCNNGIMTGIANGQPQCQTMIDSSQIQKPQQCPPGEFVTSIVNGVIQCNFPP